MQHITNSEKETKGVAEEVVEKLIRKDGPVVLALEGELGSGKTTFVKGIAKRLGIKKNITSPTFLIIKKYPLKDIENFNHLFHIDVYRLNSPDELKSLDIENILRNKKNIVVIEWADRVKSLVPKNAKTIKFSHGDEKNKREINVSDKND